MKEKMHHAYITPQEYEQATTNGISRSCLEQRVRDRGWNIKRVVETPLKRQKIDWEGWNVVAQQNRIPYNTFLGRIQRYGWSMELAATAPTGSVFRGKELCSNNKLT